jgi:hypothetical protein
MSKFYTHFTRYGNKILERGYENGRRYTRKVDYQPTLYVPSKTPAEYTTLDGKYVSPLTMESMREASDFIKRYEGVQSFDVYGSTNFAYIYVNEVYPNQVDYDPTQLTIANIDIEVGSENGFPEPAQASEPITAITFKIKGHYYVFGCGDYNNYRDDVTYTKCLDDQTILRRVGDS